MPDTTAPFDFAAASKALLTFSIDFMTLGARYPEGTEPPIDVMNDLSRKTDEGIKAALQCLGEIGRIRRTMQERRQTHLPTPPATPGGGVACQACSLDGAIVPWPCGVWKLTDTFLADGK